MSDFRRPTRKLHGFTLMELMTVVVVISILAVMVISSTASLRGKAERGRCVNNLHGLYAAGASYIMDHQSWPQIGATEPDDPMFAKAWIEAFTPYKIGIPNWTCGAVQKALGNPTTDPNNPRLDYIPTSFDSRPNSPYRFPTHPWFIESADVHGDGNLILLTNGSIHTLNELKTAK